MIHVNFVDKLNFLAVLQLLIVTIVMIVILVWEKLFNVYSTLVQHSLYFTVS